MKVEIIAVGSELILGQSTDTNSVWISQQLALSGIDCFHHSSVGDNFERMKQVFEIAIERSDAVICCGGLGPTQDDLTRDAIAAVCEKELVTNNELIEHMKSLFAIRGIKMADTNLQQAEIPEGATVLKEKPGTAAGFKTVAKNGTAIYATPGVPYEMAEMITGSVIVDLLATSGESDVITSRVLRLWGVSESQLAEDLASRIKYHDEVRKVTLAYLASGVEGLKIRMTAKGSSQEEVDKLLDAEEEYLRDLLGNKIFAMGENNMEATIIDLLKEKGLTFAIADSLTGGYMSGRISSIEGSDAAFKGSVVASDPEIRKSLLLVTSDELVSENTALEMAKGVQKLFGTDIAIAITGVSGGEEIEGKSVGTVCMAISGLPQEYVETQNFTKSSERIRQLSTINLLNQLRLMLV